ncbi:hypothetical protein FIBSPDRAFT_947818 [Athelia psychrophila]|uniref:Uncharacterized protein n=1 Tax=Athelia psychrophila TaxID=1759441 RepID=A0A166RG35_9AGAM|nr:hypothetical protein FIBSPDRAFT_947818 [Fibularhizoctonia sp. CBS 109695]
MSSQSTSPVTYPPTVHAAPKRVEPVAQRRSRRDDCGEDAFLVQTADAASSSLAAAKHTGLDTRTIL